MLLICCNKISNFTLVASLIAGCGTCDLQRLCLLPLRCSLYLVGGEASKVDEHPHLLVCDQEHKWKPLQGLNNPVDATLGEFSGTPEFAHHAAGNLEDA